MSTTIQKTLLIRLSFIMIVNFFVIFMAFSWVNSNYHQQALAETETLLRNGLIAKGMGLTSNNAQIIAPYIDDNAYSALDEIVKDTVEKDQDIIYSIYMDIEGLIASEYVEQKLSKIFKEQLMVNNTTSEWAVKLKKTNFQLLKPGEMDQSEDEVYEFASPVMVDNEQLGTIRYGITTKRIAGAIKKAKQESKKATNTMVETIFIVMLLSILINYLFISLFTKKITHPLNVLTKAAKDIAKGNYNLEIKVEGNNEIADLSQQFNKMRLEVNMKQHELRKLNATLEDKVEQRTAELKQTQQELLEAAHSAGKAELAINVLHNIGNALNSVNITIQGNNDIIEGSKVNALQKTNKLIQDQPNIIDYLAHDNIGIKIIPIIDKLTKKLVSEQAEMKKNSYRLLKSIRLINETINSQQKYAKVNALVEKVKINDLIEDVISMQKQMNIIENVKLETIFSENIEIAVDRLKLYQILTNMFVNARQALVNNAHDHRNIQISTTLATNFIQISIRDNGCGISKENQKKIFNHGFTTKKEGHGFGLHSCANYLKEMGATLKMTSIDEIEDSFTKFIITLPLQGKL